MEEKIDTNTSQNDEEVKKEVKNSAEKNNDIDTQTAALNQENRIVDIEYVLEDLQNTELAFRINNLKKLGIGLDVIKKLIVINSKFSVGDTEEELVNELDRVSLALVKAISENENGIVLNDDGTINEKMSKEQEEKNNRYDLYSRSSTLSKEIIADVFDKLFENIAIENKIEFSFEHPTNFITINDIEDMFRKNANSLSKEEITKIADDYNDTDFTSESSAMLSARLFDFEVEYEKFKNQGMSEEEIEATLGSKLQEIKEEIKARNRIEVSIYGEERESKLISRIENLNVKGVIELHREFKEKRNKTDIKITLASETNKEKLLRKLLLALKYKDDKTIQELAIKAMERLNLGEFSDENIKRLLDIKSDEELNKRIEKVGYNQDKAYSYAESIRVGVNREGKRSSEERYESGIYSAFENMIKRVYLKSENEINRKDAVMELLAIYAEQVKLPETTNTSDRFKQLISMFILANKNVFEFYTREYKGIFQNGLIDIYKINHILEKEKVEINPDNKKRLEDTAKDIENAIQQNSKKINELRELLAGKVDDSKMKQIVSLVNSIDNKALGANLIRELRELNNSDINDAIKKAREVVNSEGRPLGKVNFNVENKDKREFVIEENILLLESKLRLTRGTSEYTAVLKEKERFLKSFSKTKYNTIVQSEGFEERLDKFEKNLLNESLKSSILNTSNIETESERKNYLKFLLIAVSENDVELYDIARKKVIELYPEYVEEYDKEKIKAELCKKVYGKNFSNNEIDQKVSKIKKNLLSIVVKNKELESTKVKDIDIDKLMENRGEELDASGTDLGKSELQNLFSNSNIRFSADDEKMFQQLYTEGINKSVITNQKEAYLQTLISLKLANECLKKGIYKSYVKNSTFEKNSEKINQILEKYPEFGEIIDEDGRIDKKQLEKNREFRIGTAHVEILSKLKDAIADKTMSRKMKIQIGITAYALARSNEINNPEVNSLFNKFAKRVFEEVNLEDGSVVDEKGNFIDDNILYYYNQVSNVKIDNIKSMINFVNERETIFKSSSMARRYTLLDPETFEKINEKAETEEEKRLKVTSLIKKKIEEKSKDDIAKRRMDILEKKVRLLQKKDVELIKNPDIATIFYKLQIDEKRENDPNFDTTAMDEKLKKEYPYVIESGVFERYDNIMKRLRPNNLNKAKMPSDISILENIIGKPKLEEVFEISDNRLKERKEEAINRIKSDIGAIDKKYIDQNNDVRINSIWYYQSIARLSSMGYTNKIQQLKEEFEKKFNSANLDEEVEGIEKKIGEELERMFNSGKRVKTKDIQRFAIGEENFVFMDAFRIVCKKNNKLQKLNAGKALNKFWNSNSIANKSEQIIVAYNTFVENGLVNATEVISDFMREHPDEFKDFFDKNGEFKAAEVIEIAKKTDVRGNFIYRNIQREIDKAIKLGNEGKGNAAKVYEYLTSTREYSDEEKYVIEEAITDMLDKKNTTDDLRLAFEQRDKNMFKSASDEITREESDDWRKISTTVFSKGISAIKYLPKLLSGEVSTSEYASKFFRNMRKLQRRVSKKVISKNEMKRISADKKEKQKTLPEARERRNKPPKSEVYLTDKAVVSQQQTYQEQEENNIFSRSSETIGCDVGVARNIKNTNETTIQKDTSNSRAFQEIDDK